MPASARPTVIGSAPPAAEDASAGATVSRTVIATAGSGEAASDEIDIPVGESCIAPSPFVRRRGRSTPTFEHLTVATQPSYAWAYVVGAVLVVVSALLVTLR